MKFKDRKEQRQVTETMGALLLPLMPFLNEETCNRIEIGMRILRDTDIEEQEKDDEALQFIARSIKNDVDMVKVAEAIHALEQTRWIPVTERVPEEFANVLACTDAEEIFIASYLGKMNDGTDCFEDDDGMMWEGDVIAWMPLPERYRKELE